MSRAGHVWCLLEGTVYNIAELADDLGLAANAKPEAVIAHAYRRRGAAMLDDLRGAFALVAWNGDEQAGIVAVDQLGVSALYFADTGGILSFSTEIHTLLRLMPRRPAPAPIAVIHRISGSPLPGDMTLYEGVRRLGGGHCLDLNTAVEEAPLLGPALPATRSANARRSVPRRSRTPSPRRCGDGWTA